MILCAVADLMTERNDLAVCLAERAAHEIVAEMAQDRLGVRGLADLLIGIAELVIAP